MSAIELPSVLNVPSHDRSVHRAVTMNAVAAHTVLTGGEARVGLVMSRGPDKLAAFGCFSIDEARELIRLLRNATDDAEAAQRGEPMQHYVDRPSILRVRL